MLSSTELRRHLRFLLCALPTLAPMLPSLAAGQEEGPRKKPIHFPSPIAAPREAQFALGVVWSNLFEVGNVGRERPEFTLPQDPEKLERESQASVAMGVNLRLWRPLEWDDGGLSVGLQTGVFARFRLEVSGNDLIGSDWLISLPIETSKGPFSARLRLTHWSAHLGDEIILTGGADRVDFTFETLNLLAAYRLGDVRLYGGGGLTLRSSMENDLRPNGELFTDDGQLQAGVEWRWLPWRDGRWGLNAGLDWQSADRADWQDQVSFMGGFSSWLGKSELRLNLKYFDGPSSIGQFFLTQENFWGFELQLIL